MSVQSCSLVHFLYVLLCPTIECIDGGDIKMQRKLGEVLFVSNKWKYAINVTPAERVGCGPRKTMLLRHLFQLAGNVRCRHSFPKTGLPISLLKEGQRGLVGRGLYPSPVLWQGKDSPECTFLSRLINVYADLNVLRLPQVP